MVNRFFVPLLLLLFSLVVLVPSAVTGDALVDAAASQRAAAEGVTRYPSDRRLGVVVDSLPGEISLAANNPAAAKTEVTRPKMVIFVASSFE